MEPENALIFSFNNNGEFLDYEIVGNMTLYTNPENFLGKHIKDVLPESVASVTISAINKCFETGQDQEYEYELGGQMWHAKMKKDNNEAIATITSV